MLFRSYLDVSEALSRARSMIGENYHIEPKAKEYIQKIKGVDKDTPAPSNTKYAKGEASSSKKIKEEDSPKYQTYKDCLVKSTEPLDGEYIDLKINENFEESQKLLKEVLKEEILNELRLEFDEKFEELKKEYDTKYDFNLSEDDHMDIAGHGQKPE